MGYSTNISTLEAQLENLAMLREGKGCIWSTSDPFRFAYKIREALWIARNVRGAKEKYPELEIAARNFTIEVVGDNQVQARTYGGIPAAVITPLSGEGVGGSSHDIAGPTRRTKGIQTAASIIQTWLDTQPSNDRYHFPQATLTPNELLKLHSWATQNHLIFFESDGAITLQRKTLDLIEYAWSPEDA